MAQRPGIRETANPVRVRSGTKQRNAERDAVEATKSDIGWGSQIRNYVLDQSRIKDLRTGVERSDTQKVLDGDLDEFVEASLKAGLEVGSKRSDAA